MNTYHKYTANVFLAKCTEKHEKGTEILVTTKHGKENESIVFNLIFEKDGFFYYSIIRADGYNVQERAKARAEKYQNWAIGAEQKSTQYFEASQEGRDFLRLAEPIKIGHHSEKRHRALIERNYNRMSKSVEFSKKSDEHERKAQYWESRANEINLSMPESVDFYKFKLEQAQEHHANLKSGKKERSHAYSLTYAKKAVNEAQKNYDLAVKLWE